MPTHQTMAQHDDIKVASIEIVIKTSVVTAIHCSLLWTPGTNQNIQVFVVIAKN